jgi:hypothetical protein
MSKYDSSTPILLIGSSNDDMPSQKQNISIGNPTRILNEHPIHGIVVYIIMYVLYLLSLIQSVQFIFRLYLQQEVSFSLINNIFCKRKRIA